MAGFNLGDIFVTFKANTDSLKKGMGEVSSLADKTKGVGDKITSSLDSAATGSKIFAGALVAAGVAATAFGVLSVKAFSESQSLIAQTNAVLKSTGHAAGVTAEQVTKLATALEKQTKFSDEDIRSAENLLLTFTKINTKIFPQATSLVLDMSTALGQDLKSSAIQLGKALQDPVLGVTALRRVGVAFSQDQQDVIKKLVETGQSAKAQQMIMKELTTEFGGSAKAAGDTFAGQLAKLGNQFNNLMEVVGGFIVQGITPLLTGLNAWFEKAGGVEGITLKLTEAVKKITPWFPVIIGFIIGGLIPAFHAWGIAAAAAWTTTFAPLIPWLVGGAVVAGVITLIVNKMGGWRKVAGEVSDAFSALYNTVKPIVEGIWNALKVIVTGDFSGGIFGLTEDSPAVAVLLKIHDVAKELGKFIGGQFKSIWQSLGSIFKQLGDAFAPVFKQLGEFFDKHKTVIMQVLKFMGIALAVIVGGPIIAGIALLVGSLKLLAVILKFVADHFEGIKEVVVTFVKIVFAPMVAGVWLIIQVLKLLWTVTSTVFTAIWAIISATFNAIMAVWNAVLKPVFDAMAAMLRTLFTIYWTIWSAIYQVVWTIVSTLAQILFVIFQGVFNWLVNNILMPLLRFFTAVFQGIYNFVAPIVRSIWNVISSVFTAIWNTIVSIGNSIWNAVKAVFNKVKDAVKQPINEALGFVNGLYQGFVNAGKSLIDGLVQGLKNGKDAVVNTTKDIAGKALSTVKGWFGIHSPSTVMAKQGLYIMQGLAMGISNGVKGVVKIADSASSTIYDTLNGIAGYATPTLSYGVSGSMAGSTSAQGAAVTGVAPAAGNQSSIVIHELNIASEGDADYFFKKAGRNLDLSSKGLATQAGSTA